MTGATVAAAARAAVGARFRLHGRDPASGLDCVGLAAHAFAAAGTAPPVPTGYALRGGHAEAITVRLDAVLDRADGTLPGDLMLVEPGPAQLHLVVRTDAGFVHADAALRRVVEQPGAPPWPIVGAWRQGEA